MLQLSGMLSTFLLLYSFTFEFIQCVGAKFNFVNYSDAIQLHQYPLINLNMLSSLMLQLAGS